MLPNNILTAQVAGILLYSGTVDPTVTPVSGTAGTLFVRYSARIPNPVGLYQKQDDGLTTNWIPFFPGSAITGGSNQGSGTAIFNGVSGTTMLFKTLTAGLLMSYDTSVAGEVKIQTSANQVTSVGTGISVIDSIVGQVASLRSIAGSGIGTTLVEGVSGQTIRLRDLIAGTNISFGVGAGSITINNTLVPTAVSPIIVTSDYVVGANDTIILANSAAPINITLPNALTFGKKLQIKNIGTGTMNVNPILAQNIDQYPNMSFNQYDAFELVPAGGQWWIF